MHQTNFMGFDTLSVILFGEVAYFVVNKLAYLASDSILSYC